MDIQQWISHYLSLSNMVYKGISWPILFGGTVWQLWNMWNKFIFEDQRSISGVSAKCVVGATSIQSANKRIKVLGAHNAPPPRDAVHWLKPAPGWLKLNVNGDFDEGKQVGAAAGVLRDNSGICVGSFQLNLGRCSALLLNCGGLKWAKAKGISLLELESDSQLAVSYTNDTASWNGRQQA